MPASSVANSRSACGSFDFKTSTRIISGVYTIFYTVVAILMCYLIESVTIVDEEYDGSKGSATTLSEAENIKNQFYIVVYAVVSGIYVLFSLLLLLGEKHHGFLIPWLTLTTMNIIAVFKIFIWMILYRRELAGHFHIFLYALLPTMVHGYCLYVVRSYFKYLQEMKKKSNINYQQQLI